jgi:hypothetical protein
VLREGLFLFDRPPRPRGHVHLAVKFLQEGQSPHLGQEDDRAGIGDGCHYATRVLLARKFHRQDRQDRKEPPTLIRSEELADRNFPNCAFEFSRINFLNMQGSFASFACFAVELHYPGLGQVTRMSPHSSPRLNLR